MAGENQQEVPVKVYKSKERLTVAAPMPGLEPQDIQVWLDEQGQLTLQGQLRGVLKGENEVLQDEWNAGDYHRTLRLEDSVDGSRGNATYNNGVLVVSLPLSASFSPGRLALERLTPTQGRLAVTAGRHLLPADQKALRRHTPGAHLGGRSSIPTH
jgi:HSP20 family protein